MAKGLSLGFGGVVWGSEVPIWHLEGREPKLIRSPLRLQRLTECNCREAGEKGLVEESVNVYSDWEGSGGGKQRAVERPNWSEASA